MLSTTNCSVPPAGTDAAEVKLVAVDAPGSRYIDFLVPGLLGMSLMGGGLWGVGFVTVDMRRRNLLKRFLATPMRKSHFLAGLMVSRMLFMVPEVIILLVFARYAFGVVIHGSLFTVVFFILLGALMFSGIGLLVASRATTVEMVSGLMNLVMVPMWIFSGIFFSSERFPEVIQPLIRLLPLTPLIDALRAVMLEGAPLATQLVASRHHGGLGSDFVCTCPALVPLAVVAKTQHCPTGICWPLKPARSAHPAFDKATTSRRHRRNCRP